MQDPPSLNSPEADAEMGFKSTYFGRGDPRSGVGGKWDREEKEANNGAWYLTKQDARVGNWGPLHLRNTERQKKMYLRVVPIEEDGISPNSCQSLVQVRPLPMGTKSLAFPTDPACHWHRSSGSQRKLSGACCWWLDSVHDNLKAWGDTGGSCRFQHPAGSWAHGRQSGTAHTKEIISKLLEGWGHVCFSICNRASPQDKDSDHAYRLSNSEWFNSQPHLPNETLPNTLNSHRISCSPFHKCF